jgi:hypothetical protein
VTAHRLAAVLIVGGSAIFLLGAAIGVPAVFLRRDPDARHHLLRNNLSRWRIAQPLYGLGPLLAAAGVGVLATEASGAAARTAATVASLTLAAGAFAWTRSLYQRMTRIAEFAHGNLPRWPFATYVLLTICGLAMLAVALLADDRADDRARGIAWTTIAADVAFLAAYLRYSDLPPFVFYLLFPVVAAALW